MDRRDIVNKEFPTGRRGYEPEAVDAHLGWIAGEVETLRRSVSKSPPRTESLATAASERVRTIVEAAETSAAEIEREAEEDARRLREESTAEAERTRSEASTEAERTRSEAAAEAEQTRNDATAEAQGHVSSVRDATSTMLERVESLEKEARSLVDSLLSRGGRLTGDLDQLETEMGELRSASGAAPVASELEPVPVVDEPAEPLEADRTLLPTEAAGEEASLFLDAAPEETALDELEVARAEDEELRDEEPELDEASATTSTGGDTEGARLIALNMALNGTPREETDRYLAENFSIEDRAGLLDEVYARLG
ncbi:MAG: DivIVA domain-containing protein [Solirubrobacteraceae bacterium]